MLAGVGGRTVAEAKANLSHKEVIDWMSYVNEHGSLSPVLIADRNRDYLEWISAKISWAMFKAMGAKSIKISDFIPKKEEEAEVEQASITEAFSLLKSLKVSK